MRGIDRRTFLTWAGACAAAAGLTGCTASAAEGTTLPQAGSGFVFVCPITGHPYWQDCARGIARADEDLGTSTEVTGPVEADSFATQIVGFMEEAVAQRPAGIMTYAGVEGLYPLIDQAVEQGIPVVAVDSDAPETARLAYVGIDAYNAGYRAGEELFGRVPDGAETAVLMCSQESEHEKSVLSAFQDAVFDHGLQIVAVEETDGRAEVAEEAVGRLLADHPQLAGLFCTGASNATGAGSAKLAHDAQGLTVVGFDDVDENLALLRQGGIDALLVQSPFHMGYQAVHVLKECVDAGAPSREFYDTGLTVVTRDNVDTYKE